MESSTQGRLLKAAPARSEWTNTQTGRFFNRIEAETGRHFETYRDAWQWSVDNLDQFWGELWRETAIIEHAPYSAVLGSTQMPGAEWFPGALINWGEHLVRGLRSQGDKPMLIARSQTRDAFELTGNETVDLITRIQQGLIRAGIKKGDRVVGYLPNIPETIALFIAATSLGAVFCSVPPEMGTRSVLDRISQLEPSLIVALDGYSWGAKHLSRVEELAAIREALPSITAVLLPYADSNADVPVGVIAWNDFTATAADYIVEPVPFATPLVVLFSSGTTGKPKAIVHGHGGLLVTHMRDLKLMFNIDDRDRTFWFSTTGWMVWTLSVSTLMTGASMVLMDGDPNWPEMDGEWSQWAMLGTTGATYFATGSAYLAASAHAGIEPGKKWDLSKLREIQCSGSPLASDVAVWVYDHVNPDLLLAPASGGTDICSGFLSGSALTGVYAGEMAVPMLGVALDAWSPEATTVPIGEPGELVCTKPLPSMPLFFWGDDSGERYKASYFDVYPGVWRHGDWLIHTERDTWIISGRSDATLNRGGVRLGTAEFYGILDPLPGVADSMVLHFEDPAGGMGQLVLLAVAKPGADTEALEKSIRTSIRTELSPRHVPDTIVWVPSVPRTATGKRLEIPLKRVVQFTREGKPIDPSVMDRGVLVHPDDVDGVVAAVIAVLPA
jgi:acetoacetyl-CoA synthetase